MSCASGWSCRGTTLVRSTARIVCAAAVWALATVTTFAVDQRAALGTRARCEVYSGLPAGFPHAPLAGLVWIAGGALDLGSRYGYPEERGGGSVRVPGFWIDATEVTNAQFARFVESTGHV